MFVYYTDNMLTTHDWWNNVQIVDAILYDVVDRGVLAKCTEMSSSMMTTYQSLIYDELLKQCGPLTKYSLDTDAIKTVICNRLTRMHTYIHTLDLLMHSRGIEQRTPDWYEARKHLITASDAAQALGEGKFGTRKDFFKKKIDAIRAITPSSINMDIPPLQWGIKYEPVAAYVYEHLMGVKLHDFGLMIHPTHKFIGASPDGINDFGIMLEIKCPYRRKISGEIPSQYYTQMQLQMDVCNLRECDYMECEIMEYADDEILDVLSLSSLVGKVDRLIDSTNTPYYAYNYLFGQDNVNDLSSVSGTLFAVTKFNIVRVHRDDTYLRNKIKALGTTWQQLQTMLTTASDTEIDLMSLNDTSKSVDKGKVNRAVNSFSKYEFLER